MNTPAKKKMDLKMGKTLLFFSLFLCLFQIFISFPIALWNRNKFNFEAPLTHSFSVVGITLLAIIALSGLIAFITPKKIRSYLIPLFSVLAALIFIQQNFLAWNYGILDGHSLDFKKNAALGFLDLAVWVVAIGSLFFARNFIKRQVVNILLGVGAMAVIMTVMNVMNYGSVKPQYAIDETTKFDFSKNKNVILMMFDAYQMDVLLELAESEPELMTPLEGFTLYENNTAVFAKTYPTVPLFLTGEQYKKEQPLLDFFETVYDDSLMEKMQKEGWDVGLYPNLGFFPALINAIDINPAIMDNVVGGVPSKAKIDTYLQSLDLALFRAVPHHLKSKIFNGGNFVVKREPIISAYAKVIGETDVPQPFTYRRKHRHNAISFAKLLEEHGQAVTEAPTFKFYHFMLPHAPNRLDKDLNLVKHQNSFEAYRGYSIASLKLLGQYLENLKTIGAYDNATIMIVSDHGMGTRNTLQYDPALKNYKTIKSYGKQRSAAKSILLVKEPGQKGALKRSNKPVSGIDIAPTLAAAAGIGIEGLAGKTVQNIADNEERIRQFNYYNFSTWDSKYLDDFETFEITGDVREDTSWTRIGMTKQQTQIETRGEYKIGQLISFGEDVKNDTDFLNAFIDIDEYKKWTNYIEAANGELGVNIKLETPAGADQALLLQFEIYSGVAQDRNIIVNGKSATTFIQPKQRQLNRGFFITPDMHQGQENFELSFQAVDKATVKPLRLSSIKLSVLEPQTVLPATNIITDFDAFFPIGFDQQKDQVNLIQGRESALIFVADKNICRNHKIRLELEKDVPIAPMLSLNNKNLALVESISETNRAFNYECSDVEITKNNVLKIILPSLNRDEINDQQMESISLKELSFEPSPPQ